MKESYALFNATKLFVAAVHAAINCMVGTARMNLFNWLLTRKTKEHFVLQALLLHSQIGFLFKRDVERVDTDDYGCDVCVLGDWEDESR
nr:hypothetical protein [Tanacetum cinerariifolium]